MYAANFREIARKALKGKWKKMAWLVFLAAILGANVGVAGLSFGNVNADLNGMQNSVASSSSLDMISGVISAVVALLLVFLGCWVRIGLHGLGCRVLDGEKPKVSMLFVRGIYWKSVGMSLMRALLVLLWFVPYGIVVYMAGNPGMGEDASVLLVLFAYPLIIPGVIASFRYAMADYILYNHPEMGVMEILRESKRLMHGRKGKLFGLQLSFIGWILLCIAPLYVGLMASVPFAFNASQGVANAVLIVAMLIGMPLLLIGILLVDAYRHIASIAFYRWAEGGEVQNKEEPAAETAEEPAADGEDTEGEEASTYPASALTANETVAKDVFWQHGCSRKRLEQENLLEEYNQLDVSPFAEMRWLREYANTLILRFDRDPEVLDEILELSAEYGMDDLLSRALERIDRHIRQETLPAEEILNMAGRLLALVTSGEFEGQPGYVQRKREQVSDIADRLEHRLQQQKPDGEWQNAMRLVRSMCGQN